MRYCLSYGSVTPYERNSNLYDMRLLHIDTLEFTEFTDEETPIYAIASHRWQKEEVTFQEVNERRNTKKKGYQKVREFAKYIRDNFRKVKWLWIDTCCINKDSAAELSEAINLMFKWYRNAGNLSRIPDRCRRSWR